jgi:hypothetical protein
MRDANGRLRLIDNEDPNFDASCMVASQTSKPDISAIR